MAKYDNHFDCMSKYEALLLFNGLVLNGELSTLLKENGFNFVEPRIEKNAEGVSEFFLLFKKDEGETSCRVTYKDTIAAGSVNDEDFIFRFRNFFRLKASSQYHVHVTKNLSKVADIYSIRVVCCQTHEEYVKSPISQRKQRDLQEFEKAVSLSLSDWIHFTVICSSGIAEKVKYIARTESFTIREVVEKFFQDGISRYEARNGRIEIAPKTRRSVEDIL